MTKCLFTGTLLPVEAFSPDPNRLFSSVKAANLNLPEDCARRISSLISYYGGQLLDELTSECTHLLADSLTDVGKKLEAEQGLILVTPDWVLECIGRSELVEAGLFNPKYLLSDPMNAELDCKERETRLEKERLAREAADTVVMMDFAEIKTVDLIKKSDRIIELRKSTDNNFQHPVSDETGKAVHLIKLVSPKPVAKKETVVDDGDHDFKNLSASSIQTQLENTIRLNQTSMVSKQTVEAAIPAAEQRPTGSLIKYNNNDYNYNVSNFHLFYNVFYRSIYYFNYDKCSCY